MSSAEQPLALPPEETSTEATTSPGLTQTSERRASLLLADTLAGKLRDAIMDGELDIPHNRVRFSEGLMAKDEGGPGSVRETAHELRTPLNAIIGLCQCLERDVETPLTERQRDTVKRMERNAHALLQSVNRLLERMRGGSH